MVKASVGKGIVYFFTALFAFVFIAINLAGIFFIFTLFNVAFASQPEISQTNKMCITCHEEEKYLLQDSVHQKLDCTFCHTTFKQFPHPTEINLAQEVQVACQRCHQGIAQEYAVSIHGDEKNSLEKGTTCYSCHGSHDIFTVENPEAKHNRLNVNDSCIQCHDGRVLEGYNYSFHGVAFNSGYIESANCVDCHGSHS
ncbi:MAG: hypothetical protein KGZ96_00765, partial [Clostridia bacterium]|nr:hypothetical protein [Clostridia bacterium]